MEEKLLAIGRAPVLSKETTQIATHRAARAVYACIVRFSTPGATSDKKFDANFPDHENWKH